MSELFEGVHQLDHDDNYVAPKRRKVWNVLNDDSPVVYDDELQVSKVERHRIMFYANNLLCFRLKNLMN